MTNPTFIQSHDPRKHLDQYMTPVLDAQRLVGVWRDALSEADEYALHRMLEPHVGDGNFVKAFRHAFLHPIHMGDIHVSAMDLDDNAKGLGPNCNLANAVAGDDFLTTDIWEKGGWERPDVILGNPPYGEARFRLCTVCKGVGHTDDAPCTAKGCEKGRVRTKDTPVAEKHIRRALSVSKRHTLLLVRQGLLAGKGRSEGLWQEHPPRHVWTLGWRPKFLAAKGKGGDRYDYAWIWWDKDWTGPTTWSALPRVPVKPKGKPLIEVLAPVLDAEDAPILVGGIGAEQALSIEDAVDLLYPEPDEPEPTPAPATIPLVNVHAPGYVLPASADTMPAPMKARLVFDMDSFAPKADTTASGILLSMANPLT